MPIYSVSGVKRNLMPWFPKHRLCSCFLNSCLSLCWCKYVISGSDLMWTFSIFTDFKQKYTFSGQG